MTGHRANSETGIDDRIMVAHDFSNHRGMVIDPMHLVTLQPVVIQVASTEITEMDEAVIVHSQAEAETKTNRPAVVAETEARAVVGRRR